MAHREHIAELHMEQFLKSVPVASCSKDMDGSPLPFSKKIPLHLTPDHFRGEKGPPHVTHFSKLDISSGTRS